MADYLILNKPFVFNGLGTLTYNVTETGNYNVNVQTTFPAADPISYDAAGSGHGRGAGTGGGGQGFVLGDRGLTYGGVGQGFGTGNNYQQPPSAGSNITQSSPVTSSLSILVKKNGVTIYTSTTPAVDMSALQFKTSFQATVSDVITVVLSSSATSDNQKSGITSNISIGQGF